MSEPTSPASAMSICSVGPASVDMSEDEQDDDCPICYRRLYEPYTTRPCQHTFCHACLLASAATSKMNAPPLPIGRIPDKLDLPSSFISCPTCRTPCRAQLNSSMAYSLETRYPKSYNDQVAPGVTQNMILCFGNTQIKDSHGRHLFMAMMGIPREYYWTFFLTTTHPHLIESVDIIMDPTSAQQRFATLRKPPFEMRHCSTSPIVVEIFITLKQKWQWKDTRAGDSRGRCQGTNGMGGVSRNVKKSLRKIHERKRDRIGFEHVLCLKDSGKQEFKVVEFSEIEDEDDVLPSLARLFGEEDGAEVPIRV